MIAHFYHIWCNSSFTVGIIQEHIKALQLSGLDVPLRVGLVGPPHSREGIKRFLSTCGHPYEVVVEEDDGWEQVTLNAMHDWALQQTENYKILYAHTKGAFYQHPVSQVWREQMTYWNITKWKEATALLDSGVMAAGIHLMRNHVNELFFGGTFWWCQLNGIKMLDKCKVNNRYEAEVWIGLLTVIDPTLSFVDLCPSTIGEAYPK